MDCTKCKWFIVGESFCDADHIQCHNQDGTITSVYGYCQDCIER